MTHLPHMPQLHPVCVSCLVKKQIDRYPATASREQVLTYLRRMGELMATLPDCTCGPEIMERLNDLRYELFGEAARAMDGDYTAIKQHFNALMLDFVAAEDVPARIRQAEDPLRAALGFSMAGNYIDFGAMESVDEAQLRGILATAAEQVSADSAAYRVLAADLARARRVTLLTDNCGEIVMDRLLVELWREQYPSATVTVLVRGESVLNDATMDDAHQVGLDRLAGVTVLGNGDRLAGTALGRISPEALAAVTEADVVVAKGQGNYESMQGCGLNVYYAFLCKCRLFADRFSVPPYTGMLVPERQG